MRSYSRQLHKLAILSDDKMQLNTSAPQRTDKTVRTCSAETSTSRTAWRMKALQHTQTPTGLSSFYNQETP